MRTSILPEVIKQHSSRRTRRERQGVHPVPALMEILEDRRLLSGDLFVQTNLHSDGAIPAAHTDPPNAIQLVNSWGIAFGPNTPFWIADNGTGLATVYDGQGVQAPVVVSIPGGGGGDSAPTGEVFNPTSDFMVTANGSSGAATFIFVGEDGGVSGWNRTVDPTHAILMADNSTAGAVFKGATLATMNGQNVLLAADFHNGRIDAFNGAFQDVTVPGSFQDPSIPAGFAPFNVQNIGGKIYVTYAKQDADAHDDVSGAGNGFVDIFNADGTLAGHLQHGGFLNSPWGVVQAPDNWGKFSGDILVGNFGSGHIDAFDPVTGQFRGKLHGEDHKPVTIDGLWGLTFGNGTRAGDPNTLYFTAGPNHEANGLFGSLTRRPKHEDQGRHGEDEHGGHDLRNMLSGAPRALSV